MRNNSFIALSFALVGFGSQSYAERPPGFAAQLGLFESVVSQCSKLAITRAPVGDYIRDLTHIEANLDDGKLAFVANWELERFADGPAVNLEHVLVGNTAGVLTRCTAFIAYESEVKNLIWEQIEELLEQASSAPEYLAGDLSTSLASLSLCWRSEESPFWRTRTNSLWQRVDNEETPGGLFVTLTSVSSFFDDPCKEDS